MNAKFKKNIIILVLVGIALGALVYLYLQPTSSNGLPKYSTSYIKESNVSQDFDKVIIEAQKTNKKIFMIVGGDWCPFCRGMDQFFKKDDTTREYLFNNFVTIKAYTDHKLKVNQDFFEKHMGKKVPSTPHFLLFTSGGKFLKNYETTPLEIKGTRDYDSKKMMTLLEAWQAI